MFEVPTRKYVETETKTLKITGNFDGTITQVRQGDFVLTKVSLIARKLESTGSVLITEELPIPVAQAYEFIDGIGAGKYVSSGKYTVNGTKLYFNAYQTSVPIEAYGTIMSTTA